MLRLRKDNQIDFSSFKVVSSFSIDHVVVTGSLFYQDQDGVIILEILIQRYRCLSLLFLLCLLCTISVRNAYRIQYNQYILTIITSCVCILSYLFTTMVDPGIVWDSREMDLENDPNSVYCSICGVYRPKLAGHCVSCNVCFDE